MSWLLERPNFHVDGADDLCLSETAHSRIHGKPRDMSADFPVAKGSLFRYETRQPGHHGGSEMGVHGPEAQRLPPSVRGRPKHPARTDHQHLGSESPEEHSCYSLNSG